MLEKVLTGSLTFTSLTPCDLNATSKQEIRAYFENSYDLNESLFTALKDDSVFYKFPDRLRLPLIFYYGHTASVYVNKLILADLLKPEDRVNLEFETMFETGVDEMSWDDTENYRMGGKFEWPALDDVIEYRRVVRNKVLRLIDNTPLTLPVTMDSPWWAVFMGMEHERIHLETSSVLIRQLPEELVSQPPGWAYGPVKAPHPVTANPLVNAPAREVTLGKPLDFPSYGWDNEYGRAVYRVPEVEISKYPITNREFHAFMLSGGYDKRQYWTDEGWEWKQYRRVRHPTFWVCGQGCKSGCGGDLLGHTHCKPTNDNNARKGDIIIQQPVQNRLTNGQNGYCNGHQTVDDNGHQGSDEGGGHSYRLRCMFDVVDMPWDWPVETNYHEARAFCLWRGPEYRLLTEAEHHVIRGTMKSPTEGTCCDIIYQKQIKANLNFQYGSSTPVNLFPPNDFGFCDTFGNVWEWTEDHHNGLPGFQSNGYYDDFSSPCFDGRHNAIMGGSWISTGDEASRFARYAFRRHFFQHCGFRVARDIGSDNDVKTPVRIINTPIYTHNNTAKAEVDTAVSDSLAPDIVASSYVHYVSDTEASLQTQLEIEYGYGALEDVAQQMTELLSAHTVTRDRAIHLGCGVGSVSFCLAKYFSEVLALDTSAHFIEVCLKLQEDKPVTFTFNGQDKRATRPEISGPENLVFKQLNWLPNEVGFCNFLLATFFDRVQNTTAWIYRLREIIVEKGLLVIASEDWTEETLSPLIGKYFTLVHGSTVSDKSRKDKNTTLTMWRRY